MDFRIKSLCCVQGREGREGFSGLPGPIVSMHMNICEVCLILGLNTVWQQFGDIFCLQGESGKSGEAGLEGECGTKVSV